MVSIFFTSSLIYSHQVVNNLDLEKFMGRWYVIAIVPNWIEKGCINAYDDYTLNEDGTVDVTYFAIKDGKERSFKQKGYVDSDNSARWEMQFMKPYIPFFKAPYEVIVLDSSYNYMVVGYPDNSYGWIMSRSNSMESTLYEKILSTLELDFGYDKSVFKKVLHES